MKYRIHLTAGRLPDGTTNGLPVSETRQRYAISDPWRELADEGKVTLTKAKEQP